MNKTIISWTKHTWNPVHGCSRVSEGCRHCYAEQLSLRYGWTTKPWTHANAPDNVRLMPHKLKEPYKIKDGARIFVNSMSDLFHPLVPDAYIRKVFDVMNDNPHHTFQILTKRPERAAGWTYRWAPHIWMGVSVEDRRAVYRIDILRQCPAHVRFVSAEPLIDSLGQIDLTGIHWLIVGGESGKGYRPLDQAWAREIRDQCVEQGTAFFFKQDSGARTEMRPWLVEEDGSRWRWQQWPDEKTSPVWLDNPDDGPDHVVEIHQQNEKPPEQLTLL